MERIKNILLFGIPFLIGIILVLVIVHTNTQKVTMQAKKPPVKTAAFSVENAPSQSLRGSIASFSGSVKWQSRIATEASVLTTPVLLQQGEEIETEDSGTITISIPGVCTVTTRPKTHLSLIQTLPINIVLEQKEGDATYTKLSSSVLTVRSLHLIVNLISGSMQVQVDPKQNTITVSLTQGEATAAFNNNQNITKTVSLSGKKQLTFADKTRKAVVKTLSD